MIAIGDARVAVALAEYKVKMAAKVEAAADRLKAGSSS
jgi:hypothetical protein